MLNLPKQTAKLEQNVENGLTKYQKGLKLAFVESGKIEKFHRQYTSN